MSEIELIQQFRHVLSEYAWPILLLFFLLMTKDFLGRLISGIAFMLGSDFKVDDIVYIKGRKSRIVRQTMFKTIFYILDTNRKMIVSNKKLYHLEIEKEMPKNGDHSNNLKEKDNYE